MGTPNFASPSNTSKYFIVLTNVEEKYKQCDTCLHRHYEWEHDLSKLTSCENRCEEPTFTEESEIKAPELYECEDFISNIGEMIEELGGTAENESLDSGSYGIQSLGYISLDKYYGDVNIEVQVTATLQSAYYEGGTLDYKIEIYNGGEMVDVGNGRYANTIEHVIMDLMYSSDMPIGMQKIQSKNAEKWAENTIEKLSKEIEELFETVAGHKLQCDGVFSNGEAIYSTVK